MVSSCMPVLWCQTKERETLLFPWEQGVGWDLSPREPPPKELQGKALEVFWCTRT